MIEVSHLSKRFGEFKAVDDVSFSIPTGQIVGLLGPNGAGKSTTMRMITGFFKPTSGSVLIDDIDITKNPVEAKQKIGYMPESAPLYADMIVEEYLRYVALMQNQNPEEKISKLCDECGLKEVMHKNISELSRGYKQRVGLAHALMNDPEILILDEPTSGLDPNQIEDVRNLIREIGKTRTVIISTHILSEVEMLCGRVIIISKGKLVADSPTAELRERYGHSENVYLQFAAPSEDEAKAAISSIDKVDSCTLTQGDKIEGTESISLLVSAKDGQEIRPELFRLCAEKNWTIYEMAVRKNSLEDIFHGLTVED
ncbi:MAG: ABC transporter ATP-binding protein [Treponema sp.]|nr:ABC transporter ATP-binding protein [Treponema sp.]